MAISVTDEVDQVRSELLGHLTGLSILDRVVRFIKIAGSAREASFDHNGFLSYHAESHALGAGIAVGFLAAAAGLLGLLGVMLKLAIYGNRGESLFEPKLLEDILSERHYFLGGIVAGVIPGLITHLVVNGPGVGLTVIDAVLALIA